MVVFRSVDVSETIFRKFLLHRHFLPPLKISGSTKSEVGCANSTKLEFSQKPNQANIIFAEDKDTFVIEPNIKNSNNDKLVIYFHGSAGPTKYSLREAFILADYGFKVVHLCWYNCNKKYSDDLDPFEKIDLKVISLKLQKILNSFLPSTFEISLVGVSRGAEVTSLLISHPDILPFDVSKAVLISGISVIADSRKAMPRNVLNQRLLNPEQSSGDDSSQESSYTINAAYLKNRSAINVVNYKKSLMIIHGKLDKLWSVKNAFELQKNYEKNGLKANLEIISDQGHSFPKLKSSAFESLINFLSTDLNQTKN